MHGKINRECFVLKAKRHNEVSSLGVHVHGRLNKSVSNKTDEYRNQTNGPARLWRSLGGQNLHGQTEGKLPQMDYAAAPKSAPGSCENRVTSAGVYFPGPLTRVQFGEWNNDSFNSRIRT
ncbi:hypothetical protein VNO77_39420 [Canavalia gladiata]|uniref:Uncharacterized protein n=1 Tax=Canavalia gladiata TaxID=3824 RepID=A0AAN9PXQ9_CANGL